MRVCMIILSAMTTPAEKQPESFVLSTLSPGQGYADLADIIIWKNRKEPEGKEQSDWHNRSEFEQKCTQLAIIAMLTMEYNNIEW